MICLLSIFNDLSDVTWLSLKSQDLKTVKHLKTVLNLRTREHLSIPNTCEMPHLSKPERNQRPAEVAAAPFGSLQVLH